jgi:hypothetical protein
MVSERRFRSAVEMPESPVRRDVVGSRREGRRSLSAYTAQARGARDLDWIAHLGRTAARPRRGVSPENEATSDFSAGMALALVYPLVRHARHAGSGSLLPRSHGNEGASMKRKPTIKSLQNVTLDEATVYLDHANGDELNAAYALAVDRARLDGSNNAPDDAEVHHAFFLLCRARGKHPPSFDDMRVQLRRRAAA